MLLSFVTFFNGRVESRHTETATESVFFFFLVIFELVILFIRPAFGFE